jgi:hypothetical protein
MERLIIIASMFLLTQCNSHQKNENDFILTNNSDFENEESVTASLEIPIDLDSAIHKLLPNASVFWILEESVLTTWPEKLKNPIQEKICMEDINTSDCKPSDFNVINLNDSLELIIDYSSSRSGSAGMPYYVYNTISKQFISKHLGTIYGIVKSNNFIGLVFRFRYSGENGVYEYYESLEEITGNKVKTYAILTPNRFNSVSDQRKDFESNKKFFFSDQVK